MNKPVWPSLVCFQMGLFELRTSENSQRLEICPWLQWKSFVQHSQTR